jgi:hypothetical protein
MHQRTVIFNRQVIRLCKGMVKAWEQWVDDVELEAINPSSDESKPQIREGDPDKTHETVKK